MPEYSGSLQSFDLALALWLAPLLPLLAAVYAGLGGYVGGEGGGEPHRAFRPRSVALVLGLAAAVLVSFHLVVLAGASPGHRHLISHAWGMLRIGSLDANFAVSIEPGTGSIALVCSVLALLALWSLRTDDAPGERRLVAAASSAASGALFVCLGDDLTLVLVGAFLSALGGLLFAAGKSGPGAASGFVIGRIGDAALLGAMAILLWGLAGSWSDSGEYIPDFRPRLVAVQVGAPAAPVEKGRVAKDATGLISMAALPGASLSLGGGQLCALDADGKRGGVGTVGRPCREVARSPFSRLPTSVALHDIQVTTGPGTNDLVVEKTRISPGQETLITAAGATTVIREMRDQLALRDQTGGNPLRAALTKRRVFGQPLLGLVVVLTFLFVTFRTLSAAQALTQRAAATSGAAAGLVLGSGVELVIGVALLTRLDFLMVFVPASSIVFGLIAALGALVAAARASHSIDVRECVVLVAVANLALATLAAATGSHAAALSGAVVTLAGVGALALALGGLGASLRLDAVQGAFAGRAKQGIWVAVAALSGAPVPLVGNFWSRDGALFGAASAEGFTSVGWVVFAVALAASAVAAFASFRLAWVTAGSPEGGGSALAPRLEDVVLGLAAFAVTVGLLSFSKDLFGDSLPGFVEAWWMEGVLDAKRAPIDRSVRWFIAGAAFASALVGFLAARARYAGGRKKDLLEDEAARPLARFLMSSENRFDAFGWRPALAAGRGVAHLDGALEALLGLERADSAPAEARAEDSASEATDAVSATEPSVTKAAVQEEEPAPRADEPAPPPKKRKKTRRKA